MDELLPPAVLRVIGVSELYRGTTMAPGMPFRDPFVYMWLTCTQDTA